VIDILMLYPDTFRYEDRSITDPITVKLGEHKIIDRFKIEENKRGVESAIVHSMSIQLNSPMAIIRVEYQYGSRVFYAEGSPISLRELNLSTPNPTGLWLSRYDDTEKIYVINYTPIRGLPFWDEIRVFVIPTTEDVTVEWYSRLFLVFDLRRVDEVIRSWFGVVKALKS